MTACLGSDLTVVAPLLLSRDRHHLAAACLPVLALAAAGWLYTYRHSRVPFVADLLQTVAIALVGVATQFPVVALAIALGPLMFASLFGSSGRAALRGGAYLAAFSLAARLSPALTDWRAVKLAPGVAFCFAFTIFAQRTLATVLSQNARSLRRQRALSDSAARLMTATELPDIGRIATEVAVQIAGGPAVAYAALRLDRDGDQMLLLGETGMGRQAEPSRELRVPLCDGPVEMGRLCMVVPALESDHDLPAALQVLARQAALAIEGAAARADLEHRVWHDALTGLPNRQMLCAEMDKRIAAPGPRTTLVLVGLDVLKDVNDALGHELGDKMLVASAERLRSVLGDGDLAARLDGEEFALLVSSAQTDAEVDRLVEAVREALSVPLVLGSRLVAIGASIGLAHCDGTGSSADEMLRRADLAMCSARSGARGLVVRYEAGMEEPATARITLREDLDRALARQELFLEYQPEVRLSDGGTDAFEALLRWRHPKKGLVPPMTFVPVAEQNGAIVPIGKWVFSMSCAQLSRWRRHGLGRDTKIAVNVSSLQLSEPGIDQCFLRILASHRLVPSDVIVEVTESVAMSQHDSPLRALQALRQAGASIALDDFGTGYSSLSYLSRLPANVLKIDRSFVVAAERGETDRALLRGISDLGRSMSLQVVAEGVETASQAELVRALGCQLVQGYLFSKPVTAPEASKLLARPFEMPWTSPVESQAPHSHSHGKLVAGPSR
ncbi:MAG: bifunctional diguanylate cyclase/phosphodiesterase [Actinomycetota bacterium]|nr:bifunctional diguanylate cyclase/phosphodiesterase [Actinomycetota bacterium]